MRSSYLLKALILAGSIASASAAHAEDQATVTAAIDARERAVEACFTKRDAECLVNGFYVSDANVPIASPPGGQPPVRGRAALIKMFEHVMQEARSVHLEHTEIFVHGKVATELGRSQVILASGKTVAGRFSVLWMREKDGWRAKLDFFADDGWM
jgi:hypothetical protein